MIVRRSTKKVSKVILEDGKECPECVEKVNRFLGKEERECKECDQVEKDRQTVEENRRSFILRCLLANNADCTKINAEDIILKAKRLVAYQETGK